MKIAVGLTMRCGVVGLLMGSWASVAAGQGAGGAGGAGEQAAPEAAGAPVEDVNTGRLSLTLSGVATSSYFFRGYLQEDEGLIFQPSAALGVALVRPETEGGFSLDVSLTSWNSFHSEHTGSTGDTLDAWYETDFVTGLAAKWDVYTVAVNHTVYAYPSNRDSRAVQEINVTLGVDLPGDEWYSRVVGDPSVTFGIEVDNSNVGQEDAAYFQLDMGPTFDLFDGKASLKVPFSLGLSLNDYYVGDSDETFGFASIGAAVTVPLASGAFGDWSLSAGVNVLLLGDTTQRVNHGDSAEVVGFVGVTVTY